MINCTLHNYREWIGSYMDGSLSPEDMQSAETFFELHPNILDEHLLELEEFNLVPDETRFPGRQNLSVLIKPTQHIHSLNYQEVFVSFYENHSRPEQIKELNDFLSLNPVLEKEFKAFGASFAKPDLSVVYPYKKELLKKSGTTVPLFWRISAAASVLIIIGAGILFLRSENNPVQNGVAMNGSGNIHLPVINTDTNSEEIPLYKEPVQYSVINQDRAIINHTETHSENYVHYTQNGSREFSESVHIQRLQAVFVQPPNMEITLKEVPEFDHHNINVIDPVAENKPERKGIFNKIVSGEKIYIEDYVNATFSAFKDDKKDDSKWVLKVDRDKNGKSKKIKFSSPLFSIKTNE